MTGMDDRINRRTALAQLTAATMFAAGAAKAQRPDPSLAQIKTTDLGHKTYMLEGQGGNILVVIGDDGIIMVDAELAPLHDKIKAAITDNSTLPIKYLVDTHFHGEQTGGNAPFHRDGAVIVAQDNVRVRLLAGTTNGLATTRAHRRIRMRSRPRPMWAGPRPCESAVARRCSLMPPMRILMGIAGFILRMPTSSSRVISSTITAAIR
jgi:glyoxylase-like metal-dependent hydrolase (beta-lactamase superfamily II)